MTVGVVIVNYDCAALALDAALSALGDGGPGTSVVIVDNASTDESILFFRSALVSSGDHQPVRLATTPAPAFASLQSVSYNFISEGDHPAQPSAALTILAAQKNRGFAAGSNLGLRFLMECAKPEFFLLLNPDAVLARGSVAAFKERLADKKAGLCGATVLRWSPPHEVQAFGGARLRPMSLLGDNLGAGRALCDAPHKTEVERRLSYPLGAAMAFRRDYLENVGFLDERYFLYYEEADWARAGALFFRPVWAPGAVVYHQHGAAAGSRQRDGERSPSADYHMARSRILYAVKWRPLLAPLLIAAGLVQALRRLMRGHLGQARAVLLGCIPGVPKPRF